MSKMFHVLSLALGIVSFLIMANGCISLPEKYTAPGTLGSALEREFAESIKTCNILSDTSILDKYSVIPSVFRSSGNDLDPLGEPVTEYKGLGPMTLFSVIFDEGSKAPSPSDIPIAKSDVFLSDFSVEETGGLVYGRKDLPVDSLQHVQGCAGHGLVAMSGGVKLSAVQAEAAIKTETAATSEIVVLRGTFWSPLHGLLFSKHYENGDREQTWARMKLWSQYKAKKDIPFWQDNSKRYYVTGFSGTSIIRGTRATRNFDAKGSVPSDFSMPLYRVAGNTEIQYKRSATTKAESFTVLVAAKSSDEADWKKKVTIAPLPDPSSMSAFFSKIKIHSTNKGTWLRGDDFTEDVVIKGVPAEYCPPEGDGWIAKYRSQDPITAHIIKAEKVNVDSIASDCKFTVALKPSIPNSFFDNPQPLNYQYELEHEASSFKFGTQEKTIKFTVKGSVSRANDLLFPQIGDGPSYSGKLDDKNNPNTTTWKIELPFIDASSRAETGQVQAEIRSTTCKDINFNIPNIPPLIVWVDKGKKAHFKIEAGLRKPTGEFTVTENAEKCSITVAINFQIKGGKTIPSSDIAIPVQAPRVSEKPTKTPPSQPGISEPIPSEPKPIAKPDVSVTNKVQ